MVKIGFTGTQQGMTVKQLNGITNLLMTQDVDEFHHGCCIGADAQASGIARGLQIPIVYHPPVDYTKMAVFMIDSGEWRKAKPYLKRNHDIVDETHKLIATPKGFQEELRSGTWATIRYAWKMDKKVAIIYPNGEVSYGKTYGDDEGQSKFSI